MFHQLALSNSSKNCSSVKMVSIRLFNPGTMLEKVVLGDNFGGITVQATVFYSSLTLCLKVSVVTMLKQKGVWCQQRDDLQLGSQPRY